MASPQRALAYVHVCAVVDLNASHNDLLQTYTGPGGAYISQQASGVYDVGQGGYGFDQGGDAYGGSAGGYPEMNYADDGTTPMRALF